MRSDSNKLTRPRSSARVLHVLGSLGVGGAETWVVQILEQLDDYRVGSDLLINQRNGAYENRVLAAGAKIHYVGNPRHPFSYSRELERFLVDHGPYDVVHCHLQSYSGLILRSAFRVGVPGRIAHARNSSDGKVKTPMRLAYRALMRFWIKKYATQLFAVSTQAAESAFWEGVMQHGRCRRLTGVDFTSFCFSMGSREDVRKELSVTTGTLVVGHVGSFRAQKNHRFLLEIAQELLKLHPNTVFVLVGDGPLRRDIVEAVTNSGMQGHFRFLGTRNDVARLLCGMDVFLFPSFYEGLPRVMLEAQATGLPCIASSSITSEVAASLSSVQFISLERAPKAWAQSIILTTYGIEDRKQRGMDAVQEFDAHGLTIAANAKELTELYERIASANRS